MESHFTILAWNIPWMEEPGGLYSLWGCKESDTAERAHTKGLVTELGDCQSWKFFSDFLLKSFQQSLCLGVYTLASFWERLRVLLDENTCTSWFVCVCMCVRVRSVNQLCLFVTLGTVAHQSLSMGFPRLEHWGGLPFPTPRDLSNPGINTVLNHFTYVKPCYFD